VATDQAVERILKHDRRIILVGLAVIAILGWTYLINTAAAKGSSKNDGISGMADMVRMNQFQPWTAADAVFMFTMWSVMMLSMMVPSATPVILLYARVYRRQNANKMPYAPTGAFFAGYITVWLAFSAVATLLQWRLEEAALLSPMLANTSPVLGGVFLIIVGVYQWNPYKKACLGHCRSPIDFLSRHWRKGVRGAYVMGVHHGGYCLGCCWALMLLLFVGGVMNLLWIAAIAAFILVEKVASFGQIVRLASVGLFILGGVLTIAAA
jgi:predicted metal-binding membrane protein